MVCNLLGSAGALLSTNHLQSSFWDGDLLHHCLLNPHNPVSNPLMPIVGNCPFALSGFPAWRERTCVRVIAAAARQIASSQGAGKEDGRDTFYLKFRRNSEKGGSMYFLSWRASFSLMSWNPGISGFLSFVLV